MTADVYEARTGFAAARRAFGTYGCVAVVVAGATFLPIPWAAKAMAVTLVVAFGPVMLLLAAFASRHRLVLRVDRAGVTLAPVRGLSHDPPRAYRWEDVDALAVWVQRIRSTRLSCFGVIPTAAAADPAQAERVSRPRRPASALAPSSVVLTRAWRLDRPALAAVLARVAPAVPLVDITRDLAGIPLDDVRAAYVPEPR